MKKFSRLIPKPSTASVLDILSVLYICEYTWKWFVWKLHELR